MKLLQDRTAIRTGGGNQNVIVDISLPLADAALMDVLGLFATGDSVPRSPFQSRSPQATRPRGVSSRLTFATLRMRMFTSVQPERVSPTTIRTKRRA